MKTRQFATGRIGKLIWLCLAVALAIIIALILGCDNDGTGPRATSPLTQTITVLKPATELSLEVVSVSACKNFEDVSAEEIPSNQTAVRWEFDGNGNLTVRHINAALNGGCPEFPCEVNLTDREITIFERQAGYCFGLCLVDIEYRVTGVSNGKYLLRIDEFLDCSGDPALELEILLKGSGSSGDVILNRTCFPWAEPVLPEGSLLYHTGCEWVTASTSVALVPEDSVCLIYDYSSDGVLNIEHQNAVFNCCIASMVIDFTFSNDTIYIHEDETYGEQGPCGCVCPYTVYMQIINLLPGEYTIALSGVHVWGDSVFDVDLQPETSGYYCYQQVVW